ncbi:MAG TPA: HprK-related kinase B, partial [Spirochaetes bacterium]|nr:HprK-related kinase B [Spirochaetota bacterium]
MTESTFSIDKLIEPILEKHPAKSCLNLIFGDCSIQVLSNSSLLIDKLSFYYKGFAGSNGKADIIVTAIEAEFPNFSLPFIVKKPDPGKSKIKEEYIDFPDRRLVRKRLTEMYFIFGGEENLAIGPCVENDNQVINFINNRYIQWYLHQEYLLGHASAVEWNGRGLAIAGFSGMGKSSLALQLMNRGLTLVSNDRLMINTREGKLKMYGVPKLPRVNPGTVLNNPQLTSVIPEKEKKQFIDLPSDELWDLEYKYDVFIDECFGPKKFILSAPMDALIILNWKRKDIATTVRQVDLQERRDLLSAFIKAPGLFFELPSHGNELNFSEESYIDQLKHCSVFEIKGGVNFEKAA